MSRSGAGTYSLPAGQPVVTGTVISASTFNTLTSDLGTEITDSLSRSAKGAMLGILQLHDGTSATVPDLTWAGDTDTGLAHSAANTLDIVVGGVTAGIFTTTSMRLVGNQAAAAAGADIISDTVAVRTAGVLHSFRSATTEKLAVDFAGQLIWGSGPADTVTSPGPSAVTAITPNTNITNTITAGFWKDPTGMVHCKGFLTNSTGGNVTNFVSTTPLPAGFRPAATRIFTSNSNSANVVGISVSSGGVIASVINVASGAGISLDVISYLAEA